MSETVFYQRLSELLKEIQNVTSFSESFPEFESRILELFDCDRITIYQRNKNSFDIVSRYKSGNELREIRVPIGPQSIAGYVAFAKQGIMIENVQNPDELHRHHPKLKFADRFDKQSQFVTRNMLVVPIIANHILLGVLQLINKKDGLDFSLDDHTQAQELADFIGQKFRYELGGTSGPFEYLRHKKWVTESELKRIESNARNHADAIRRLIEDAKLMPEQVAMSLEVFHQVKHVSYDPEKYHLHALNEKLNDQYRKRNCVVILADVEENAIILMAEPNNAELLMEIESATGLINYDICVGLPTNILKYMGSTTGSDDQLGDLGDILDEIEDDSGDEEIGSDEILTEEAPAVVRLVNKILHDAKEFDASDIHIDPNKGTSPTKVRMRIDGVCQEILQLPASHHPAAVARIKIMARLDIAEKRLPQDGKFAVKINGNLVEVRIATIPTVFGEGVVMRILASGGAMPFDKLNLSPRNNDSLLKMIQKPHGIILVVGPTGSGKTTTLHAVLGKLNTPDKKIWTAEDPVEITQPGLQQVQMNNKIGFDFKTALRAFLRADPDIILIGEMRDRETAHAGVEASLTGHMVLSTLHTNSAPETVTRLIDLGLDPVNFSDACVGILAQRLIRTLCGKCKEEYKPEKEELDFLVRQYGEQYFNELGIDINEVNLYRAKGCATCGDTGYKGRTGLHELLEITPELRHIINDGGTATAIKVEGMKGGMRTLVQDGIYKVLQGQTDFVQLQKITAADDQH
ncbi:general secretion pathway protein GspE [Saccharobesus litoralis]|uniref:General secretion pathway protein GspE n=1 Tax=Saccharobesus litoralis TaxID=2172099 RepID=A0A2S0VWQ0_9ALTE|nr:GspE/PulE family protein [Saccharobesus litoralis]AWB68602.1 general secretion pathway protein GspE [Saccharobesus litoralis]